MSAHLDRLDAARQALLNADPSRCAREIESFEALCSTHPPSAEEAPQCDSRLRALGAMAAACSDGVNAARQGLQDALIAAGRLTTYDAAGARATRNTRGAPGHRF